MFEQFRYVTLDVTMTAETPAQLPPYKGSTLRGALGRAFRRVACPFRACPPCLVPKTCPYTYIFETPPRDAVGLFARNSAVPHPFVLELPIDGRTEFKPGDQMTFGLVLVGEAIDFIPYFVVALREMGRAGLGRRRARWRLDRIEDQGGERRRLYDGATEDERLLCSPTVRRGVDGTTGTNGHDMRRAPRTASIPARPSSLPSPPPRGYPGEGAGEGDLFPSQGALRFETPTRLRFGGHLSDKPEFHVLMRNLLRRLSALATYHCDFTLDLDYRDLIQRATSVATRQADLKWVDWERYSARQDSRMTLGGFIGTITFEGELTPFTPFLRLGEVVHVGKGTSFGLGKYRIEESDYLPPHDLGTG